MGFKSYLKNYKSHLITFQMIENTFQSDENKVQDTVIISNYKSETNNCLKDLFKDTTD